MNKLAYLDAMGVARWTIRRPQSQIFTILIDNESDNESDKVPHDDKEDSRDGEASKHPILLTVLGLIDCPIEACEFVQEESVDAHIIWDLRTPKPEYALLRRVNKKGANKKQYLVSKPLIELERNLDDKKALWQQIWELYPQQVLDFGEKRDADSEIDSGTESNVESGIKSGIKNDVKSEHDQK